MKIIITFSFIFLLFIAGIFGQCDSFHEITWNDYNSFSLTFQIKFNRIQNNSAVFIGFMDSVYSNPVELGTGPSASIMFGAGRNSQGYYMGLFTMGLDTRTRDTIVRASNLFTTDIWYTVNIYMDHDSVYQLTVSNVITAPAYLTLFKYDSYPATMYLGSTIKNYIGNSAGSIIECEISQIDLRFTSYTLHEYLIDLSYAISYPSCFNWITNTPNVCYLNQSQGTYYITAVTDSDNYVIVNNYVRASVVTVNNKYRQLTGQNLSCWPNPFSTSVSISLEKRTAKSELRNMSLGIYDITGKLIYKLDQRGSHSAFRISSIVWDGRDNRGKIVPKGAYFVNLILPDKSLSRKIFKK
jgi:hypothetical protein